MFKKYVNRANSSVKNIRKIGMLTFDSPQSLAQLREIAGDHDSADRKSNLCYSYVQSLQPYYLRFQMYGDLWLTSLGAFYEVFHNNLIELRAQSCLFSFASTINEIYKIVYENGYKFSLQASIMECTNRVITGTDLSNMIDANALQRLKNEDAINQIRIIEPILLGDHEERQPWFQRFYDAVGWVLEHGYNNDIPLNLLIYYTYFLAIQQWLIELIDNNKLGVDITPTQNQTSLKKVAFTDRSEKFYGMSSKILNKFNDMFIKSIMYRLLNWRYSVEELDLCFSPQIFEQEQEEENNVNVDGIDVILKPTFCATDAYCLNNNDDSYLLSFEEALNNIFNQKYFAKLKNIDINIPFKTNYENAQLETVNVDTCINANDDTNSDNRRQATSIDVQPKLTQNNNINNVSNINTTAAIAGNIINDIDHDDNTYTGDYNYDYNSSSKSLENSKKIFSIRRFENTIDWYINIFLCRIVINVSKNFQRLKDKGCAISLSIGIGNITDSPNFQLIPIEMNNDKDEDDENYNVNITQWLVQSVESKDYKSVHKLLDGYARRLKQLARKVKSYVRHKDILEKQFAAPPCVLVIK